MKKTTLIFLTILLGAFSSSFGTSRIVGKSDKFKKAKNAIPNRYIVVLNKGFADFERELNRVFRAKVDREFTDTIKGYSVEMAPRDAVNLSRDARIKYVEEDAEMFVSSVQTDATWGLDRIDQRLMPLDGNYNFNRTGSSVHVYIIDTGIRVTHQDFGGRAVADFDAFNDGQNGIDCHGHGTHVAGTVGSGTFGVAKNVTLHAVRVLNCSGAGSVSATLSGIEYVTRSHISPAVANISIGASGISSTLDTALANSIASGVTYVVAAGNSNQDACNYSISRVPTAITVGASTNIDLRFGVSNFGSCVDVFAPGTSILSTSFASDIATAFMSGTSMASPHVAGAAALYLETNPFASPEAVAAAITNSATKDVLGNVGAGSPNLLLYSLFPGPTATTARIYGRVTTRPRSGRVAVTILNTSTLESKRTSTDRLGFYKFDSLTVGATYIVEAQAKGYAYNPEVLTLLEDARLDLVSASDARRVG